MDTRRIVLRATARLYQRISAQLILLAAFVGLVWFLVYFTLNSSFAIKVFDGVVNTMFRGRIAWTRVTWGPLPWQLEVLEPALIGADDQAIITAGTIEIDEVLLLDLLSGRIAAQGITIDRPVVRLTSRLNTESLDDLGLPRNVFDIQSMWWPPGPLYDDGVPGKPPHLDFEDITINRATFVLDMPTVSVTAEGIDVTEGRFELAPDGGENVMQIGTGRVTADRGGVRIRPGGEGPPALEADDADVLSFPFARTQADHFRWHGRRFTVARLVADHRGDRMLVTDYRMRLDTPGIPWIATKVQIAVREVARHLDQFGVEGVRGPAVLTVRGRGEIDAFEGIVTAAGDGLVVGPLTLDQYVIEAHKSADDHVELRLAELTFGDGRVALEGGIDLPTGRAWAELYPSKLDLTALPLGLAGDVRRLVAGGLGGPVFVHATNLYDSPTRHLTVSADLRLDRRERMLYGVGRRVDLRLDASLDGEAVLLRRLDVDTAEQRVEARGGIDLTDRTAALTGRLVVDDMAPAARDLDLDLAGSLDLRWRLSGALTDPTVRGRLKARRVRFAGVPPLDLTGRLDYRNGWLEFDDFVIDPRDRADPDARAGVRGRIGVTRPGLPLDLAVTARRLDLGPLPLGQDIDGRLDLDAELRGRAARPRGTVRARIIDPRWDGLDFRRLDLNGAYDGRTLSVERLRLFDEGRTPLVELNGRFTPDDGAYAADVKLAAVPLTLVEKIAPPAEPRPEGQPYPLRGRVTAHITGEGTLDDPVAQGTIGLEDIGYDIYDLGDGDLTLGTADQALTVAGRVFGGLDISATVPTADDGRRVVAAVAFDDLAVEDRLPQLDGVPIDTRLTGRIEARVDAAAGRLESVTADLSTMEVDYDLDGTAFRVSAPFPVALAFDGQHVTVGDLTLAVVRDLGEDEVDAENRAELEVGGAVQLEGGTPTLDLTARGGVDLQIVQPFAASVFTKMDGRAAVDLAITGPVQDMQFAGFVDLETASMIPRSSVVGGQLELADPVRLLVQPMPDDASTVGLCRGRRVEGRSVPFGAFVTTLDPTGPPLTVIRDEYPVVIRGLSMEYRRFVPDRIAVLLDATDLALNVPRVMRGTFDVEDLQVEYCQHQPSRGPNIARLMVGPGKVEVARGEYVADITSVSEINQGLTNNLRGAATTRSVSVFDRVPLLQQLYFDDLEATCDGDFYVRNQVTVLSLDLELRFVFDRIRGLLTRRTGEDQLALDGNMTVLADSTLNYARRPFEVTSGTVTFGQNSVLNADVEATHTFRIRNDESVGTSTSFDQGGGDVRLEEVTLRATYRLPDWQSPADLDIQMSSNSGLSSYEIAVLVLTGTLPDSIGGLATAQPATEMLLGPLLGLIERPLEDTLDVDLSLTPASTGTLFIDADKLLSRRLRLYSRTLVGDDDGTVPQTFGLEYRINNAATAELTNESAGNLNSTSGRLRLRFELD